ncbi:MAG: muramidase [Phyllobacteriaceae bacterium]|nr:muramidase [Phyllobacteriaceae bacterium]
MRAYISWFGGAAVAAAVVLALPAQTAGFTRPWENPANALVIDAYEYNPIDWHELAKDKRIAGFINKASDGLPPKYRCSGGETEKRLCSALWKRYSVAKELYHTRRMMAKSLGMLWGAYHLGRPGNPIDQANHFIDFAQPGPDDLIALDIEDNSDEWMSLEDAEIFVRHIHARLGRWPVLYTNGNTSRHIADNRDAYPVLSRLNLWYARYKPAIGDHFPKGNWTGYALWQFATQVNCSRRSCPYRPPGTPDDIDVNVAAMTRGELQKAWPFPDLVPVQDPPSGEDGVRVSATVPPPAGERVPLPLSRERALNDGARVRFARAVLAPMKDRLAASYRMMAAAAPLPRSAESPAPAGPSIIAAAYAPMGSRDKAREMLDRMATGSISAKLAAGTAQRFAPGRPATARRPLAFLGHVPAHLRPRDIAFRPAMAGGLPLLDINLAGISMSGAERPETAAKRIGPDLPAKLAP